MYIYIYSHELPDRPSLPPLPSHQRAPGLSDFFQRSTHEVFMGKNHRIFNGINMGKLRETMGTYGNILANMDLIVQHIGIQHMGKLWENYGINPINMET